MNPLHDSMLRARSIERVLAAGHHDPDILAATARVADRVALDLARLERDLTMLAAAA